MKKSIAILGSALVLATSAAYAASTSTTSTETVAPSLVNKLKASYSATLYGSAVSNPLNSLQPDSATGSLDTTSPIMMKNKIGVGYKFTDDIALMPVLYWKNFAREQGFVLQNPYLKLSHNKLYNRGNFNLYGEVTVDAPLSEKAQNTGLITNVSPTLISSFDIPSSRFTLSTCAGMGANLYQSGRSAENKLLTFYVGPQVDYRIRSNMTTFVLYEMNAKQVAYKGLSNDGTDLEIGLNWDITPKVNLMPLLDFKTGNRVATDTTTFITALTLKLL
ncbi:MAG: hypothetical protein A3K03_13110 [Bdellovibrionales bacterium RIFOXYD1_FULL_44_7]|nr:MAG: hypothetical protein A3K03_13110 [Bdellovibrionales bacterium RIFOXYD1_FULL_44_7]